MAVVSTSWRGGNTAERDWGSLASENSEGGARSTSSWSVQVMILTKIAYYSV